MIWRSIRRHDGIGWLLSALAYGFLPHILPGYLSPRAFYLLKFHHCSRNKLLTVLIYLMWLNASGLFSVLNPILMGKHLK
jgi:hypothetical protein